MCNHFIVRLGNEGTTKEATVLNRAYANLNEDELAIVAEHVRNDKNSAIVTPVMLDTDGENKIILFLGDSNFCIVNFLHKLSLSLLYVRDMAKENNIGKLDFMFESLSEEYEAEVQSIIDKTFNKR